MTKVEEAIVEAWGKRCPDHDPTCPVCQAWAEYDALSAAPALLAACEAFAHYDSADQEDYGQLMLDYADAIEKCRAAISQARSNHHD